MEGKTVRDLKYPERPQWAVRWQECIGPLVIDGTTFRIVLGGTSFSYARLSGW